MMNEEVFNNLNDVTDFLVEMAKNVKTKFVGAGFSDEMAQMIAVEFVRMALAKNMGGGK